MECEDDMNDKLAKYRKKLDKALKKYETTPTEELKAKIEKYQQKLNSRNDVPIDKSGMTLLLFYAYVEPPWNSAEHADAIRWATDVLSSAGVTGRLRVAREGFNGTLTGTD
jgi:hypothetical protein